MNSAVQMLDRAAERYGDRTAIIDQDVSLTYREYRELAGRIGTALIDKGLSRQPVLVLLPKDHRALLAFMGALYAGCCYAPVDYHAPLLRLSKIAEGLKPALIITDEGGEEHLAEAGITDVPILLFDEAVSGERSDAAVNRAVSATTDADPLYIIYTSGSTGVPKGVTMSHRALINDVSWYVETMHLNEEDVIGNQASFYFDVSTFDIYGAMLAGAALDIIPDVLIRIPVKLPEYLADHGITTIYWVPTVMISIANSGVLDTVGLPALKHISFAGEVMPNRQLNIWRRALPRCSYANLYGPTETNVCTGYLVDRAFRDEEPLPIGYPCANQTVRILTGDGREAAPGEKGELCVSGYSIALGYWNAPELTRKAFGQDPTVTEYQERMYRTGDLAYRDENGLIYFCGRRDYQIKIHGNRVELGEIENGAMCLPDVHNAAAIFIPEAEQIVLFVETDREWNPRKFNVLLKKYIPSYMLPSHLVCMHALPHTANEKIDRLALRKIAESQTSDQPERN